MTIGSQVKPRQRRADEKGQGVRCPKWARLTYRNTKSRTKWLDVCAGYRRSSRLFFFLTYSVFSCQISILHQRQYIEDRRMCSAPVAGGYSILPHGTPRFLLVGRLTRKGSHKMASDILQLAVFTVLCSPPSLLLFNRALHADQGEPSTHNKKRL